MNYEIVYNEFVASCREVEGELLASGGFYEKHHVVPVSMGGSDDPENLVCLTPYNHFLAHYYLAKAHGGSQWAAVHMMLNMSSNNPGRQEMQENLENDLESYAVMVAEAREQYALQARGSSSGRADLTVYTWLNEHTGEELVGTRHDVTPEGCTSEIETGNYFSGQVFSTRSGWFVKGDRFNSVEELKQYRSSFRAGFKNPNSRRVMCVETGDVFDSVVDAVEFFGLSKSAKNNIGQACKGRLKSCGGYTWAYVD